MLYANLLLNVLYHIEIEMKIRESCLQTGNFIYKPGISLTKQDFHLQRGSLGLQRGFSGYYLPAELITEKYGLEKDSYILFLGRLVPEKGIRYLVEAFKNVKTDKKLIIAGGSSDTDSFMNELKDLAKDDDRIIFTGFVQGQILKELYSNAYVYTLPSDLEGMPLSLLEAMSYGNCCLVSNIPECTEVVEDKALVFKKSDVNDLFTKIQKACDNPEMVMKIKEQATDFIFRKYNWDFVTKETMNLYRR